jgi:putative transposase
VFFGSPAGLSAAAVGRLLASWQADYQAFCQRDLADRDYVYVWVDGVHFRVRLEQARLCCLVMVGVRADGTKELVAVADGERESTDSWAEVLRDLRRRGMRAPVVAVGDGALGLWAALRDVFPATRAQRDWVHKLTNVLGCLPKACQAGARKALSEIRDAPDRLHAERAIEAFAGDYGVKWPKAVAKITDDAEELLTSFDFPAEHWGHLRTTNPLWVFSFPHQLALPEREMAGRWWQGPDSESDCCCSMDAFELEVSGVVTGREAIDGLA